MTQTIERQQASEPKGDFRLDLSKISISEYLSETSSFELRAVAPTVEWPAAIYVAAPKSGNKDIMNQSLVAVKENTDVFWQADSTPEAENAPESIGVIRGYADGSLEQLGVGDDASIKGKFKIGHGEKVYMITHRFIDTLKHGKQFSQDGIDLALSDEDLRSEVIEISFDSAITAVTLDTSAKPTSDKKAGFARRMRNRQEQPQDSGDENVNKSIEMPASVRANAASVLPNSAEAVMSAEAHRLRAERAAELVQQMNTAATLPDQATPVGVDTHAALPSATNENNADTLKSLRGFAQRKQAREVSAAAAGTIPKSTESTASAESDDTMTEEERQYLEDERRGFKITDNRKWSRVEMLGHEVGIHSDVSITVPVPEEKLDKTATETLPVVNSQAFLAAEMAKYAKQEASVAPNAANLPFEAIDFNPDDDPAIESGLARLETLRQEMADLTAKQHNRLFSFNGKKSQEITKAYNEQLITLGQFIISGKLRSDLLTDSQKNVAVMKFLVNEQAILQASTTEKLQGTKASKFVEWMNIHGATTDATVDVQKVIQSIEQGTTDDDKVRLAQRHLAELYQKRTRTEQHERGKEAARIAAIGVVGMAATVFGISPSMVGDAANNVFYGARKK